MNIKKIIFGLTFISYICFGNSKNLVVFSAASLSESMKEITQEYSKSNNIRITNNFAGSQALAFQIENYAYADLFLSANEKYISHLKNNGFILKSKEFLQNRLILIVNKNTKIENYSEIFCSKYRIALADERVPVGRYTAKVLEKSNDIYGYNTKYLKNNVVSKDLDVKSIVTKIEMGVADIGFVYKTDFTKDLNNVYPIEIPDKINITARYYAAIIVGSNGNEIELFFEKLDSEKAKRVFEKYGFVVR